MLHNSRRNPEHVSMIWWRLWIWHIPLDRNMILSRGMLILLSRASGFKVQILLVQFFYLSSSFSCSVLSAPRQCVCVVQGSFKVMGSLDAELGPPILESLLRFPSSWWLWLARLSAGSSAQKDSGLKPTLCCPQDKKPGKLPPGNSSTFYTPPESACFCSLSSIVFLSRI